MTKAAAAQNAEQTQFINRSGVDLAGVRHATVPDVAQASRVEPANDIDDPWFGEDIAPILKAVPQPERFYMAIAQVQLRKRVGAIIIPDTVISDQEWTHGLGIVVKVGASVYKGRRFSDIGLDEADAFKPGDLVHFNAGANPRRIKVDGRLLLWITDDAVLSRVDRAEAHRVSFTI